MLPKKYLQPKKYFQFFIRKVKNFFPNLENKGERVEFFFKNKFLFNENEICHLKRYEFALSYINEGERVADFACGTGYGSVLLAEKAKGVLGVDIDPLVIETIKKKYKNIHNLSFLQSDLLKIDFANEFDTIISFETLEHFSENDILKLLRLFHQALKKGGRLILSTPYMQRDEARVRSKSFHETFFIDEKKITVWLTQNGFQKIDFYFQSYGWPAISKADVDREFVICVAERI